MSIPKQITAAEARQLLDECRTGDAESDHVNADDILCALLRGLELGDIADQFETVEKWYA